MSDHPFEGVGWILHNSCGDVNFKSNIPRLSDEALLYCLFMEDRQSGYRKLKAEAKRRNMDLDLILDELPINRGGEYVLRLQSQLQEILSNFGLLESFNDLKKKSVYIKLQSSTGELELKRTSSDILINHSGKINSICSFIKVSSNIAWIPQQIEQDGMTIKVIIKEGPALSGIGYLDFKKCAKEYAEELGKEDWLHAEVLEKVVDGKDLTIGTTETTKTLHLGTIERTSKFQRVIENILEKNGLLEKFNSLDYEMVYLKLHQEPYMDLVIERQWKTIMIGHYRLENGDLISDPIMRYELVPEVKEWELAGIEQVFGDSWVITYDEIGKKVVNTRRKKSIQDFSNMFAQNIKAQDWLNAEVVRKKSEKVSKEEDLKEEAKPSLDESQQAYTGLVSNDDGQFAFAFAI